MTVNDLDLSMVFETVNSDFCFGIFSFHFRIVDGLFPIVIYNFVDQGSLDDDNGSMIGS